MANHHASHLNIGTVSLKNKGKVNVLFICLGNICRSCTAEEVFRTLVREKGLSDKYTADSAGLINYHEGELPDERMRSHALRHGYKLTHRSRPIRPEDFETADLIVAMDGQNHQKLFRLAPTAHAHKIVSMADFLRYHPEYLIIPDPYYGGDEGFEKVIELLEDACEGLLLQLENAAKAEP